MMEQMGKWLVVAGISLALLGALLWAGSTWFPLGRLKGDIVVEKPGFVFMFPIASMVILSIVLSIVLTIVLNILFRR